MGKKISRLEKHQTLVLRARELRKKMTPQERHLWHGFLQKHQLKFYRQRIINSFIVDFYCHAAKLVIELDGSQHQIGNGPAYDAERTQILESYGLRVIRFTNGALEQNFDAVCREIDRHIKELLPA